MDIKTILNKCSHYKGFVFGKVRFDEKNSILVEVTPRKGSKGICSGCSKPGPTYDTAREARKFLFVPLWNYLVYFIYCMRRIDCARCGVKTEVVPWAVGKSRICTSMCLFLASWAKSLTWIETAKRFKVSWGTVYKAVSYVVAWGLKYRNLDNIKSIGVDEMAMWKGHDYITVVYQIDQGFRRLLWIGKDRDESTLDAFFSFFGNARSLALKFIASDMWKGYLNSIANHAKQAVHVLDRFHIVQKLNKCIDEIRSKEAKELARKGYQPILKKSRWCFLKKPAKLKDQQLKKLKELMKYDLKTIRAYLLKESFQAFWTYISPRWAEAYLDKWCTRAMRSRLDPIKAFVRTIRKHKKLILNWFVALKQISSGAVEGLNGKAKLGVRKARGFRSYRVLQVALYHQLGQLPEPPSTHSFV